MTMFQNLHRSMTGAQTLKVQCEVCDHRATLGAAEAKAACGPDATPMDIRRRARCTACGTEGRVRVWI
jgi:DNA-directed RNA polymerase subunit RPC12/RpoP